MIYKGIDPNGINKVDSGSVGIFVENTQSITLRNDGFVTIGNVPTPDKLFQVGGNVRANAFYGDGSNLTGVGALPFPFTGSALISGSVVINGVLHATEKSFNIIHPTQPGKRLVYGVLEGPEHGVYARGRTSSEIIELPEEWTGLVNESTITVQLTPVGSYQALYVDRIKDNKVYIKCEDHIDCFYLIYGERKDINKLQIIQ
jgi:hypothetical protein